MTCIYHITSQAQAMVAAQNGVYEPEAFAREGFIHCSFAHLVLPVANRIFRGRPDLVVLEIDPSALGCPLVEENLEGGTELFPHIYGRLKMGAVIRIHDFPCERDGTFMRALPL